MFKISDPELKTFVQFIWYIFVLPLFFLLGVIYFMHDDMYDACRNAIMQNRLNAESKEVCMKVMEKYYGKK